jgi:hypothetical protein
VLVVTRLLRQPAVPMVDAAIQPNFAGTAAAKSPRHSIEVAIPREDQHALNFKAHAAQVPPDKRLAGGDISNVLFYPCVACCDEKPVLWELLVPVLGCWLCAVAIVAAVLTLPSVFPSAFSASGPTPPLCAPDCSYVRIMANGETCASSGHADVSSLAECEAAFAEQEHAGKRSSEKTSANLAVSAQNFSFVPKGCHSSCFSDSSGYFCRTFNSHASGSGEGSSSVDGVDHKQLYVLCRAKVKSTGLTQTLGQL